MEFSKPTTHPTHALYPVFYNPPVKISAMQTSSRSVKEHKLISIFEQRAETEERVKLSRESKKFII